MNQEEELIEKAATALNDPFFVGLINQAKAANPEGFVGKVKKVCEILELENQVAASVRYAAILARDFPARFQEITKKGETKMETAVKPTGLFLKRGQIHTGMTVALALEGKDTPEVDSEGKLLLLKILTGGVPNRVKFYPIDGGITAIKDKEGKTAAVMASGFEEFRPEVRFMPIHVFSPEEAPVDTSFVVFIEGKRQTYPKPYSDDVVYLFKDGDGRILSVNGYAYNWWLREFPLPAGAKLVPISEIGEARKEYEKHLSRPIPASMS